MFLASVSPYNFAAPIDNEFTFGSEALVTNLPMLFAGSGVTFTSSQNSILSATVIYPDVITMIGGSTNAVLLATVDA